MKNRPSKKYDSYQIKSKPTSTPQNTNPEKKSNKKLLLGLLGATVLSGAIYGISIKTKEETTSAITSTDTTTETPSPQTTKPITEKKTIDPESLPELPESIIIKKHVIPGNEKTLLFLPELHKQVLEEPTKDTEKLEEMTKRVQLERFLTIQKLVETYGTLPIAFESWVYGENLETVKTAPEYQIPQVQKLLRIKKREERIYYAKSLILHSNLPTYIILIATFQEQIIPIGTISKEEADKVNQTIAQLNNYTKVVNANDKKICTGTKNKQGYDLPEIMVEFNEGKKEEVQNCYCAICELESNYLTTLQQRVQTVSLQEVDAAINSKYQTILVSAGEAHLKYALKHTAKNQKINYVAIMPKTLLPTLKLIPNIEDQPQSFPDDKQETCKTLKQKSPTTIQNTIQELLKKI